MARKAADDMKKLRKKGGRFFGEFKTFIARGNVIDLAVGVIIGGAFQKIVNSLVNDIVMPLLSPLTKGIDFSDKFIPLDGGTYATMADAKAKGVATINYGLFLNNVIDFVIVAVVIFLMVKAINSARRQEAVAPAAPPAPTREEELLTEIRDAIRGVPTTPAA